MPAGTRNLKIDSMAGLLTPRMNRMKREVPRYTRSDITGPGTGTPLLVVS